MDAVGREFKTPVATNEDRLEETFLFTAGGGQLEEETPQETHVEYATTVGS